MTRRNFLQGWVSTLSLLSWPNPLGISSGVAQSPLWIKKVFSHKTVISMGWIYPRSRSDLQKITPFIQKYIPAFQWYPIEQDVDGDNTIESLRAYRGAMEMIVHQEIHNHQELIYEHCKQKLREKFWWPIFEKLIQKNFIPENLDVWLDAEEYAIEKGIIKNKKDILKYLHVTLRLQTTIEWNPSDKRHKTNYIWPCDLESLHIGVPTSPEREIIVNSRLSECHDPYKHKSIKSSSFKNQYELENWLKNWFTWFEKLHEKFYKTHIQDSVSEVHNPSQLPATTNFAEQNIFIDQVISGKIEITQEVKDKFYKIFS
jgi:hypothetical protein